MKPFQYLLLIVIIYSVLKRANQVRLALKEKNRSRVKAELFFLALTIALSVALILIGRL